MVFLGGDGLVEAEVDGLVEAEVDGPGGRAAPPLSCRDVDGTGGGLRPARGGYDLVETRGTAVARVGTADVEHEGWVDGQWWLATGPAVLPLRPLASVGLVLAAKVLLGRLPGPRARRAIT